jgi:hypothetical protein
VKKWARTIGRKAWHRITHLFQDAAQFGNGHDKTALPAGRGDSPQSVPYRNNHTAPSPIPHGIPVCLDSGSHPIVAGNRGHTRNPDSSDRLDYLVDRKNCPNDIDKLNDLLRLPQVLLEIGCGTAEAARQIALNNPDIGIIATDLYDWSHQQSGSGGYGQIARQWRERQLPVQTDTPPNLVIIRAEADLLRCLPLRAIDTILLINPEPAVGKSVLDLIQVDSLWLRIKQGPVQIVILPYSREMGLMACGGCSFEHDPDWSRGLGFIMASGLRFKRGAPIQWGVDLSSISAYTGNSTQREIYVCGELPN